MIMSRNGHYLPKTVHDHENARATHREGGWRGRNQARRSASRPRRSPAKALVVIVVAATAAAGAAVLQPVEQAAAGPRGALRDAAEDADQRVLGPGPRVLVRLGGVPNLVADGGAAVGLPARVVAAEDPLVLAVRGPVVEHGEPDHRERVGVPLQLHDLQDAV